jgi:hypothetical protein
MTNFIPVPGQCFHSHQEWVNKARSWLTDRGGHPEYNNTEHGCSGWRGRHFTAMCFDQKGRRCRIGSDFMLAQTENAYPIWWIWPDQIVPLLMAAVSQRPSEERSDEALLSNGQQPDTQIDVRATGGGQ